MTLPEKEEKQSLLRMTANPKMLTALLMGFSSGLPLLLTITLLQAWMKDEGVDLVTIGWMNLVGLPYALKFLWAPLLDRYTLPFLGRRRGWLLTAQLGLFLSIILLALGSPKNFPWLLAVAALLTAFFSASQDILVDAYRREDLPDAALGLGSSLYMNGYRAGMLLASGGGLILADHLSFTKVYLIMAACLLPGILTTLRVREPDVGAPAPETLRSAVIDPFRDYFGRKDAFWILAFILFYKLGDQMASAMTIPFYLDMGFTKTEVGAVVKLFGFWAIVFGGVAGGVAMLRMGIFTSLWAFGILQAVSTAGFAVLARVGHSIPTLSAVVVVENLSAGMGTAAFLAFMASITNKKFTATQYALLSSLMSVPRVLASGPSGILAKHLGWEYFFIFCTLLALPGLLLLFRLAPSPFGGAKEP